MRALLFDRDETLNEDPGYLNDPEKVRLKPGIGDPLRDLKDAGFKFFVLTNQSGVARGLIQPSELKSVHLRLSELLHDEGIEIEKYFVCPHVDEDQCDCRKPRPGLF